MGYAVSMRAGNWREPGEPKKGKKKKGKLKSEQKKKKKTR